MTGAGSPSLEAGARVLVDVCAGVRAGEEVLIVADAPLRPIAQALYGAVEKAGAVPAIVVPPSRRIDNEEPAATAAAAMEGPDVIFLPVTHALAHTRAVRNAGSARVLSMTAFTERMMVSGGLFTDFRARKPVCDRMARQLTVGSRLTVRAPGGTDLTMSLEGVTGNSHACVLDGPGFTAVPNIEANCAPTQGSASGRFVVDGSVPYYGVGPVTDPIVFEIEEGFVRSIEGGDQATYLAELLASQEDPWVYNVAQFAFGLNKDCTELTGEMLNDEGVDGTVHLGIGTSANLGGTVSAKTHFDAVIRSPTVWIDDQPVVMDGEVLE